METHTQPHVLRPLCASAGGERSLTDGSRCPPQLKGKHPEVFLLSHPRRTVSDRSVRLFIGGRYLLGSPGKGKEGGWLKWPIRKIPIVPIKNTSAMNMKQTLSITRATRNHSSFSCWGKLEVNTECGCEQRETSRGKGVAYVLEVVLLPCSLCDVFAGGHTLPHLWRRLSKTDAELLSGGPIQPVICG